MVAGLGDAELARPTPILGEVGFFWRLGAPVELSISGRVDVDTFDWLFAANVRAPYFLVAAIAPRMAARGAGSIVNVGSMAGAIGMPGGAAYGATKAAPDSMTRSWAAEFSPSGVRINTVASGPGLYRHPATRDDGGGGCYDPA